MKNFLSQNAQICLKYYKIVAIRFGLWYNIQRGETKMKLLAVSDTHGYISKAAEAIEKEQPDYILHLGDMCKDCIELEETYPNEKIIGVIGNNDSQFRYPEFPLERFFTLCGKKIFMCHGHEYYVRGGVWKLAEHAREIGADIVLYGHTHEPYLDQTDEITIMNPGSICTYGVIEIDDNEVKSRIEMI